MPPSMPPHAKAVGLAPLGGVLIAATVAMCASAVGRVVLQVIIDVLAKRDSSVHAVSWIRGGVSVRFFVAPEALCPDRVALAQCVA